MHLKPGDIVRIKDDMHTRSYAGSYSGHLAVVETLDTEVSVTVRIKGSHKTFTIPNGYLELQVGSLSGFDEYINEMFGYLELDTPPIIKCECGAVKLGTVHHYDWCVMGKHK